MDEGIEKIARLLSEEMRMLSDLFRLSDEEKHSIINWDYEGLLRIAKDKESLAWRLKSLHENLTTDVMGEPSQGRQLHELLQQRDTLIKQVVEKNHRNRTLVQMHQEHVTTLLAFMRNLCRASPVYDRRGRMGSR
jgi:flagellar biosynthesis/type III secretory pathway chaperone